MNKQELERDFVKAFAVVVCIFTALVMGKPDLMNEAIDGVRSAGTFLIVPSGHKGEKVKGGGIPINFLQDVAEDTTPQLGGNLDGQTHDITTTGTLQTGNHTIGSGAAGVDYTLGFDGEDNDGVLTWDEDNGVFVFNEEINSDSIKTQDAYTGGSNCSFVGLNAGATNNAGNENTAVGLNSLYWNATGDYNTCLGNRAGYGSVGNDYSDCLIAGYQSGFSNTTGSDNTFLGYQSGYANTTSIGSVFVGHSAGYWNTTSLYNTYVGYESGMQNNAASNTCVGYQAGKGVAANTYIQCVCIGQQAGFAMETGADGNVFVGYQAGIANTIGEKNVFLGPGAGFANTTGSNNFFMGYGSGLVNQTGVGSIYVGRASGGDATGDYNIHIGYYAGEEQADGDDNTTLGRSAGEGVHGNSYSDNTYIGAFAGRFTTTGGPNVALGYAAGLQLAAGCRNVILGPYAGYDETGSDHLIIDNCDRGSEANGRSKALIHGVFDADPANQTLDLNADVTADGLTIGALAGVLKGTAGAVGVAVADTDYQQPVTWGNGLAYAAPTASVNVDDSTIEINADTLRVKDDGVTYSKIQDVSATDKLLGRVAAGAGVVEEVTCTDFGQSILDDADAAAGRTTLGLSSTDTPTFDDLKLNDTDASNQLTVHWNEDDSSDRTLNVAVNAGDRTVDLSGNLTVEAASTINQDLSTDATGVQFAELGIGEANPDGPFHTDGPIYVNECLSDNPTIFEGTFLIYMSNGGTGPGDDGDVFLIVKAGGNTRYTLLHDHSEAANW